MGSNRKSEQIVYWMAQKLLMARTPLPPPFNSWYPNPLPQLAKYTV